MVEEFHDFIRDVDKELKSRGLPSFNKFRISVDDGYMSAVNVSVFWLKRSEWMGTRVQISRFIMMPPKQNRRNDAFDAHLDSDNAHLRAVSQVFGHLLNQLEPRYSNEEIEKSRTEYSERVSQVARHIFHAMMETEANPSSGLT